MVAEKIRIKKYLHPKVEQWCTALEINDSRFIEDAIVFYLRYLEGKYPAVPIIPTIQNSKANEFVAPQTATSPVIDSDDPDDYDGGLDL